MKPNTRRKLSDYALNALAFVLAGGCTFFAGYMILRLQGMENPPADMGTFFPPSKKNIITDDAVPVDPGITNSIDRPGEAGSGRILQPYTRNSPVLGRRLLAVIDGVAFVEVTRVTGREIVALGVGSDLPEAGAVERIDMNDGRWRLVAGDVTLLAGGR